MKIKDEIARLKNLAEKTIPIKKSCLDSNARNTASCTSLYITRSKIRT